MRLWVFSLSFFLLTMTCLFHVKLQSTDVPLPPFFLLPVQSRLVQVNFKEDSVSCKIENVKDGFMLMSRERSSQRYALPSLLPPIIFFALPIILPCLRIWKTEYSSPSPPFSSPTLFFHHPFLQPGPVRQRRWCLPYGLRQLPPRVHKKRRAHRRGQDLFPRHSLLKICCALCGGT